MTISLLTVTIMLSLFRVMPSGGVSSLSTATDEAGVGRTSRDLVNANGGNDQVDASALAVADYAVLVKAVANATG